MIQFVQKNQTIRKMPTTDFDSFYDEQLLPSLQQLRDQSRASRRWLYMVIASAVLLVIYIYIRSGDYREDTLIDTPIVIFFILLIVSLGFHINSRNEFQVNFKESIIKKILDFIYPNINYEPEKYISSKFYKNSSLYRYKYDSINGDDLFKGVYKNVPFSCSELSTKIDDETIFSGLFFAARINNYYSSGTYVWSKENSQYADSISTERYRYYPMPKVTGLKLQHEAFDKYFTACSTYPAQAREILTEERIQQMINFCIKINRDISFSFVGGHCYVAVPSSSSLFEAAKDPGDKERIKNYFLNIILFLSLIDKLRLDEMQ